VDFRNWWPNPAVTFHCGIPATFQTYPERDVRALRQVGDPISFQNFLRALAARAGQLLNLTDVARNLGIAVNTAKAWLSVLEATFQVIVLRPYHADAGKRLVKTPKVYFTDTGTLCYLAGLKDPQHAAAGPLGGFRRKGSARIRDPCGRCQVANGAEDPGAAF
jgi:predicted AAA+ superfamily ATPase